MNPSPKRNIIVVLTRAQANDVVFMIDASCCNSVDNNYLVNQFINKLFIFNSLYHIKTIEYMFEKHATKGRLVYVAGKLQTRRWKKDDEDSDRFSTEILLVPGGRVQFLDKPNGNGAPVAGADPAMPSAEAAVEDIPF